MLVNNKKKKISNVSFIPCWPCTLYHITKFSKVGSNFIIIYIFFTYTLGDHKPKIQNNTTQKLDIYK